MPRTLLCLLLFALQVAATAAEAPGVEALRRLLPVPGKVLIDAEGAEGFTTGLADGSSAGPVPVSGGGSMPPAATALQVVSGKAYTPEWSLQAFSPVCGVAIAKGDVIALACWMRAGHATGGASAIARIRFQQNGAPWDAPVEAITSCDETWKVVHAWGVAGAAFPAGTLLTAFHLGQQAQTIEIGALVIIDEGPGIDPKRLPRTRITWPGMEADAPWRAEAQRRIERYRMATLAIQVVDAQGAPVIGAQVHVRQLSRDFTFGSFVQFANPTALLTASPAGDHTRDIFTRLFNRATCPLYWADWGWPSRKDEFLAIGQWLHDHHITTRGHVLVYPNFHFLPNSLVNLKDDPPTLAATILAHIDEVCAATRALGFREYDVTNELRDCQDLTTILGRDAVVSWYAQARKDLPGAKLALNENTILTNGGATTANQEIYLDWYHYLASHGQAPDVLGFQGHFSESFTSPPLVWSILDRFAAKTKAELQITEFDINTLDEQAQAAYTHDFLTACFAHPRITGITMWGFWEGDHWLPRAAFYRTDWTPKPNGVVLEKLLTKDWWTDSTVTTDGLGRARVPAFLGQEAVEARLGTQTVRQVVELHQAAASLAVRLTLPAAGTAP